MANDKIVIKGAREHNLKNIDLTLPREKFIVMTGLSGSGKSSLAFDTIYADGQRRYVESLSSYARMFLGRMDKPDVDEITGLSPAISIDQKTTSKNPRSTVGTVTEIYIDDADATVTVVEINYYLGQVSKVKSDSKGEYVTVKAISTEPKLDDNDFYAEGYEEDDYVVFTVDYNEDEDFYICELMAPETVNGEVTRVEKDKDAETGKGETGETYLKLADGAKYSYSGDGHIVYDLDDDNVKAHPALNEQYTLYLDPNGYVLGFVQETGSTQYLYVKDSDEELRDWVAKVVLADATSVKADLDDEYKDGKDKVKIDWVDNDQDKKDKTNIDEKVWAYTVGEDKIYTLKAVDSKTMTNAEINNGKAYISDGKNDFIVDKKTVFVDVEGETAYTGYNEVPDVDNATLAYVLSTKNGNVAEIVFIVDGDVYDSASTYFMLSKTTRESLKYDGDYYWEYTNAYVNGVKQSVYVDQDLGALEVGHLYKATKTVDEKYITGIEDVELKDNTVNARGDGAFWLTTVEDAKVKYDVDDDTVFVYVDVEPVSFNRGFYTVDMRFFYHVTLQAYLSCPVPVTVSYTHLTLPTILRV